ncbi:MAG: protein kinase, partial [Planctomycetes bacterium]|nr:protein kinase [Planctomycetota bacterium]
MLLRFLTGEAVQDSRRWGTLVNRLAAHCQVQHEHLQRCFEIVDLEAFKFLVMEDLDGRALDSVWESGKRLAPPEASRVVRSVAMGLDALQRGGLAHSDVRPQRIWLEKGGHVRLLRDPPTDSTPIDFFQPDPEGSLLARADYLAPDFLQADKTPDSLTDIYALGCVFYHLLTGQPPFPGGDIRQKMVQHASQALPSLESMGIPKAIADVVASMLAKDPGIRCQDASRVAAQLTAQVEPSRLNIAPPMPPPTLAVYEQSLRPSRTAVAVSAKPPAKIIASPSPAAAAPLPTVAPARTIAAPKGTVPLAGVTAVPVAPVASAPHASALRSRHARPKQTSQAILIGLGLGIAALLILIGLIVLNNMSDQMPDRTRSADQAGVTETKDESLGIPNESTAPSEVATSEDLPVAADGPFVLVNDDGQTPWLPPTAGSPISLKFVPPGSQIYVIARPADLIASSEGPRILEAMGPAFASVRSAWETAAGCSLGDVQQLILSLHDGGSDFPRPAIVVRLVQAVEKSELLRRWGDPTPVSAGEVEYYRAASGWSFYVPQESDGPIFVMGPEDQIRDVIEFRSAPPAMRLAMNKLLAASDDRRQLTILFSPNELIVNLFRDGRQLSMCDPRKIREPL